MWGEIGEIEKYAECIEQYATSNIRRADKAKHAQQVSAAVLGAWLPLSDDQIGVPQRQNSSTLQLD